jgi:predicted NBD/HSP70 family sugar kinase
MPLRELEKNISLLRDINEIYILKLIKEQGPISRAEIARRYNISRAAVSDIVNRLLDRRFVQEIGEGVPSGRGGRKPVLLTFNYQAGFIISMEMKKSTCRIALCDLQAEILDEERWAFPATLEAEKLLDLTCEWIETLLQRNRIPGDRLLGISLGIPGLVDFDQGILKEAHTAHPWANFPLKEAFEKKFNTNIYIDNDIKLSTIGEYIFGQQKKINTMILLGVREGIGAGFILNGQIYRGITYSAGEVGYDELGYFLPEKNEFPLLFHGQRYLGDILSLNNLIGSFQKALENGRDSFLRKVLREKGNISPGDLVHAASEGDELSREILTEYGHLLGILSVNLINHLNPEMVVFDGEIFEHNDLVLDVIRERVHRDILHLPSATVQLCPSVTKRNSEIMGGVGLVLEDLFEPPAIDTRKYRMVFEK